MVKPLESSLSLNTELYADVSQWAKPPLTPVRLKKPNSSSYQQISRCISNSDSLLLVFLHTVVAVGRCNEQWQRLETMLLRSWVFTAGADIPMCVSEQMKNHLQIAMVSLKYTWGDNDILPLHYVLCFVVLPIYSLKNISIY